MTNKYQLQVSKLNKNEFLHATSYSSSQRLNRAGGMLLATLFIVALLERTIFDLGPNIELVTMAMIVSSVYFGSKYSFWLTLFIMVVSDFILGNSNIFIFTWSGFLIPALISENTIIRINSHSSKFKIQNSKLKKKIFNSFSATIFGITANIFFFLWTNFGVWLLGSMYPKNAGGLLMSYIMGLPFLKNQELSTLIFVPLGLIIAELALRILKRSQKSEQVNLILTR